MAPKKKKDVEVTSSDNARQSALDTAIRELEKSYGKGTVRRMGDKPLEDVPVIPTGCIDVDFALGVGGLPRGRITEIYGPESSGKTTLALHAVAEAQKAGGVAAFIDAEHALDPIYAKKLGVDLTNLYVSQPDNGEQALGIAEILVNSGAVDIIVIDSVAALVPQKEIEGEMGDSVVGLQARLMSQALRKLTPAVSSTGTVMIFINQIREKVGVMYGNPETTPGGRALKFYATVRIDVRRKEPIKDGAEIIGNKTQIKIVKNKVAAPFRTATCDMLFGEGLSRASAILEHAVNMGYIHKSGSFFSYEDKKLAQGKENCRRWLKENPEVADEIERKIRDELARMNREVSYSALTQGQSAPTAAAAEEEEEFDL